MKNNKQENQQLNIDNKQDQAKVRDFLLSIEGEVVQYINNRLREVSSSVSVELPVKINTMQEASGFYNNLTSLYSSVYRQRTIHKIESATIDDVKVQAQTEPKFWFHECRIEGEIGTEDGHECNWCGEIQASEISA